MRSAILSISILLFLSGQPLFGQSSAAADLLQKLINLPAPAPFDPPWQAPKPKERAPDFHDEDNPPPDDAPIEDLLEYWKRPYRGMYTATYVQRASKKTVERILEYCEGHPEVTTRYLAIFPPTPKSAEAIKRIYDKQLSGPDPEDYGETSLREWLKFNSTIYIDELVSAANQIKDVNNYVPTPGQHVLRALARVDWDTALPIIQRLENDLSNPYSVVLAKWVKYRHAIDTGDTSTESSYREELQKIVSDKKAQWAIRDLAMDSLTHSPHWEGRDEWYLSLLEDETLLTIQENGYTGLTTLMSESPRKPWIRRMIELTESKNVTVRSVAARNLMSMFRTGDANILKALIPWLADPGWAKESRYTERTKFIRSLAETIVPEAVPGLISLVMNDENMRGMATVALIRYKDPRAVPALRMVLASAELPSDRRTLIVAILACGGFSDDEQMAALEAFVTQISTEEGERQLREYGESEYARDPGSDDTAAPQRRASTIPLQILIGGVVGNTEEPTEGLVQRAIERLKIWQRTNPKSAALLAEMMRKWKGKAIYAENLRQLRTRESDIDDMIVLLANRSAIREATSADLSSLRGARGTPRGIGSCINEDRAEYLAILEQEDVEAMTAMLGCARLLRAELPVSEVGSLLNSQNKLLALAAERYLESEDSLEARKLVLEKNKGSAMILGARTAFVPNAKFDYDEQALTALFASVTGSENDRGFPDFSGMRSKEDDLRKELMDSASLTNVYAILTSSAAGHCVIRVYKDRAVFTFHENEARYRERNLTPKELKDFRELLTSRNVDGQKPQLVCRGECPSREFVMFGKEGGRRIFFESVAFNEVLKNLVETIEGFRNGEGRLRYHLADKVAGVEVLLADDKYPVKAVWKKGDDLRLLVQDVARGEEINKEVEEKIDSLRKNAPDDDDLVQENLYKATNQLRLDAQLAGFSWRKLENGRPGNFAPQPAEAPFLYDATQVKQIPNFRSAPRGWQVRSDGGEIRADNDGNVYKIVPGHEPVKFKEGRYRTPMVSGDGKWLLVSKSESEPKESGGLVRVNLQTGREYKVALRPADDLFSAAFVYSQNKFLVYRGRFRNHRGFNGSDIENIYDFKYFPGLIPDTPATPEFYLVDPATGTAQIVKGEFRPLEDQTYRPLQPTGNPGEFWTAIYDKKTRSTGIGRYSDKTFTFRPVLTLPNIELNSMDIWVDEPGGKIYFVYEGHLLSLPIK